VRAERDDDTPVALKLIYPHREAEHEGDALRVWDGDGAVALLEHDAGPAGRCCSSAASRGRCSRTPTPTLRSTS
jgi:hypothetical protein